MTNDPDLFQCSVLDSLTINLLTDITADSARHRVDRYCDLRLNCINRATLAVASSINPIVSDRFRITFISDQRDKAGATANPNNDIGYKLDYRQNPC